MHIALKILITVVVSYFIGNINFAVLLSRLKHGDIRKSGSGNPGTMNVVRTFGKIAGASCLILDAFKAAVPAFFGWWFISGELFASDDKLGLYVAGLAVVVGHIYPIFMKFKGGKGIACIIGISLVSVPIVTLIAFAVGFVFIVLFKIGAMGSFIMIFVPNLYQAYILGASDIAVSSLIFAIVTLALLAHRSNIYRLFSGRENLTVIFKKKKKPEQESRETASGAE